MPVPDSALEFQFDRRFNELESRLAFQEQALTEMSDALAVARAESARHLQILERVIDDLRQLRPFLYPDPSTEPLPPHY